MTADFNTEPFAFLFEAHHAAQGRGVWHFTPDDWLHLVGAVGNTVDFPLTRRGGERILALDTIVSDTFTSPPVLAYAAGTR